MEDWEAMRKSNRLSKDHKAKMDLRARASTIEEIKQTIENKYHVGDEILYVSAERKGTGIIDSIGNSGLTLIPMTPPPFYNGDTVFVSYSDLKSSEDIVNVFIGEVEDEADKTVFNKIINAKTMLDKQKLRKELLGSRFSPEDVEAMDDEDDDMDEDYGEE